MEDREVEEGDCLGVSEGDPAAVEGLDSAVVEVIVRLRTVRCGGMAVEAMFVVFFVGLISEKNGNLMKSIASKLGAK
jgi:hypothetical protein